MPTGIKRAPWEFLGEQFHKTRSLKSRCSADFPEKPIKRVRLLHVRSQSVCIFRRAMFPSLSDCLYVYMSGTPISGGKKVSESNYLRPPHCDFWAFGPAGDESAARCAVKITSRAHANQAAGI